MKTSICLLALAAALPSNSPGQPAPLTGGKWVTLQHGPSFDWPSAIGTEPATGPIRKQDLLGLLNSIDGGLWGTDVSEILDFRFALLLQGKTYLIVTNGGRNEGGGIGAYYCEQNRCFSDGISAIVDLKTDLVDVDGDGALEVIGKECVSDCSGVPRHPTFVYSIYKFIDSKGFIDYSAQAANFYREHLLPKIEAARNEQMIESEVKGMNAALEEKRRDNFNERGVVYPPVRQVETYKAAAQYAYDDYRRRVLGEKDAGLDDAVRWLQSETTWDFALGALVRIPTPIAEAKLREAANSKNPRLAEAAQGYLDLRAKLRAKGLLQ